MAPRYLFAAVLQISAAGCASAVCTTDQDCDQPGSAPAADLKPFCVEGACRSERGRDSPPGASRRDGGPTDASDASATDVGAVIDGGSDPDGRVGPGPGDGHSAVGRITRLGAFLEDVHGAAPDDVWAVGRNGATLHFDGRDWTVVNSNTRIDLTDVWVNGRNEAYAAGAGLRSDNIHRWDGARWSAMPGERSERINDVWASAPDDVWVIGQDSDPLVVGNPWRILRWDGATWTVMQDDLQDRLQGIWGSGADDVWVVSDRNIRRWDGQSWSVSTDARGDHVWGSGPADVWVSTRDVLYRFDGSAWRTEEGRAGVISGTGPEDVFIGQDHFDGQRWRSVFGGDCGQVLRSVYMSAPARAWAVGRNGAIFRYERDVWTIVQGGLHQPPATDVHAQSSDDVWIALGTSSRGCLLYWDGGEWTFEMNPADRPMQALHGASGSDVWGVGRAGAAIRWDGQRWSNVPTGTAIDLEDVWAAGVGDVWAVGRGGLGVHHDGTTWSSTITIGGRGLTAVYGSGSDDIWAVGNDTDSVRHFDGTTWRSVPIDAPQGLVDVWSRAPDDAWAAGRDRVLHWDGQTWAAVLTDLRSVEAIGGTAADDVWIAGGNALFMHWDGVTWTDRSVAIGANVTSIHGRSGRSLWAIGSRGIYEHDGRFWARLLGQGWSGAPSVWRSAPRRIWVARNGLSYWAGDQWRDLLLPDGWNPDAVWGRAADDVWSFAGDGRVLHFDGTGWRVTQTLEQRVDPAVIVGAGGGAWGVDSFRTVRLDGTTWSVIESGTRRANDIASDEAGRIWVAGDELVRRDGDSWTEIPTMEGARLSALSIRGPITWTLGEAGLGRYSEAGGFEMVHPGAQGSSLAALGDDEVLAIGGGQYHHLDATGAHDEIGALGRGRLWTPVEGELWVGGEDATLLRLR